MTDLIFCHKIRVTRVLNRYTFKQKGGDDNMHSGYPIKFRVECLSVQLYCNNNPAYYT